jgi:two-component system, NtrC family, response regulator AlgB
MTSATAVASVESLIADYPEHLPVLVVDDDADVRSSIGRCLQRYKIKVVESATLSDARRRFRSGEEFSFVFLDRRLDDGDGVEFAAEILEECPNLAVAIITANGSGANAEKAIEAGAFAYLPKPFTPTEIRRVLFRRYPRLSESFRDGELAGRIIDGSLQYEDESGVTLIAHSPQMIKLRLEILEIAQLTRCVLVSGGSGTGKELVARKIHEKSPRAKCKFVAINCGAMNIQLIESTLFGHWKGAFTGAVTDRKGVFEEANGGTVLLDEVTETSEEFQIKLLRVLQEHRISRVGRNEEIAVNVRVIAASNRNVAEQVRAGKFREDLYFRLKGSEIVVPALRDRREDIEPLAFYFANLTVKETKRPVQFSRAAMTALHSYDWPGNVRELQSAIDSAVQRCNGIVLVSDLPKELNPGGLKAAEEMAVIGHAKLRSLEEASNDHILLVLRTCLGNKSKAARILNIARSTLIKLSQEKGWDVRFADEWESE